MRHAAGCDPRGMRISWIKRMLLVLVRSRPGNHAAEQLIAAISVP